MKSLTKKIFITIITGIIIIVFATWGMGDLFSTGNTNTVAKVGDKKIYVKDYLNYARLYVRKKNNKQLVERDHSIILNALISEKIYEKFAEDLKIKINDKSLAFFIKNDENFKDKNGVFSRIEYEKYLLINNLNPKNVENFYKRELIKKITIEMFVNGVNDTNFHKLKLEDDFLKQVQIKYYKLNILNKLKEKEINEYYTNNKNKFSLGEMRDGRYASLSYQSFGYKKENDNYYLTIDNIENDIINNSSFDKIIEKYKLKAKKIEKINKLGLNKNRLKSVNFGFAKPLFSLNKDFKTEIFEINNVKYLLNIQDIIKKDEVNLNDKIKKEISVIINLEKNKIFADNIVKSQDSSVFFNIAKNNNIKIQEIFFNNVLDDKKIFNQSNMEKIFMQKKKLIINLHQDNQVYLVKIHKISKNKNKIKNLDKALSDQVKQDFRALLLRDLDKYLIKKYPVILNNKVLNQVKKSI